MADTTLEHVQLEVGFDPAAAQRAISSFVQGVQAQFAALQARVGGVLGNPPAPPQTPAAPDAPVAPRETAADRIRAREEALAEAHGNRLARIAETTSTRLEQTARAQAQRIANITQQTAATEEQRAIAHQNRLQRIAETAEARQAARTIPAAPTTPNAPAAPRQTPADRIRAREEALAQAHGNRLARIAETTSTRLEQAARTQAQRIANVTQRANTTEEQRAVAHQNRLQRIAEEADTRQAARQAARARYAPPPLPPIPGTERLERALNGIANAAQRTGQTLTASLTLPLGALGAAATKSAIDIDGSVNSLKAFLGDTRLAEARFNQLTKLASQTPGLTSDIALLIETQARAANATTKAINDVLPAIGRLNAVQRIENPGDFARNLIQLYSQSFEAGDLKELVGKSPLAGQIIKEVFGVDSPTNGEAIKKSAQFAALKSADDFLSAFGAAAAKNPALQNVTESLGTRVDKLRDRIEVALRPLGNTLFNDLEALLNRIVPYIERASKAFADLTPAQRQFVVVAGLIAAAAGPLLIILSNVAQSLIGLRGAWLFLSAAFAEGGALAGIGAALGSLLAPLTAIAAAAAAIYLAYQTNFAGVRDVVDDVVASFERARAAVVKFWDDNKSTFAAAWANLRAGFTAFVNFVRPLWDSFSAVLGTAIRVAWEAIKLYVQQIWTVWSSTVKAIAQLINGDWRGAMRTMATAAQTLQRLLEEAWSAIARAILTFLASIIRNTIQFGQNLFDAWRNVMARITQAITDALASILRSIDQALGGVPGMLLGQVGEWYNAARNLAASLVEGIVDYVSANLPQGLKDAVDAASRYASTAGDYGKRFVEKAIEGQKSLLLGIKPAPKPAPQSDPQEQQYGPGAERIVRVDDVVAAGLATEERLAAEQRAKQNAKEKGSKRTARTGISDADQAALDSFERAERILDEQARERRARLQDERERGFLEESEYQQRLAEIQQRETEQRIAVYRQQLQVLSGLRSLDAKEREQQYTKLGEKIEQIQNEQNLNELASTRAINKTKADEQLRAFEAQQKLAATLAEVELARQEALADQEKISEQQLAETRIQARLAEFDRQLALVRERIRLARELGLTQAEIELLGLEVQGLEQQRNQFETTQAPAQRRTAARDDRERTQRRTNAVQEDQAALNNANVSARSANIARIQAEITLTAEFEVRERLRLKRQLAEQELLLAREQLQQRLDEIEAESTRERQALQARLEEVKRIYGDESAEYQRLIQTKAALDQQAAEKAAQARAEAQQQEQAAQAQLTPFGQIAARLQEAQPYLNSLGNALGVLGNSTDAFGKKLAGLGNVAISVFQKLAEASASGTKITVRGYAQMASAALASAAELLGSYRLTRAAQALDFVIKGSGEVAESAAAYARFDPVGGTLHAVAAGLFFAAAAKAGYQAITGAGDPNRTAAAAATNTQQRAQAQAEKPFYAQDPKLLELLERPVRVLLDVRSDGTQIVRTIDTNVERNGALSNLIRGAADPIASY